MNDKILLKNLFEYGSCKDQSGWKIENLDNSINLIKFNLSKNKIIKIESLNNLKKLKHLNLSNNPISKLEGLDNFKLTRLFIDKINFSFSKYEKKYFKKLKEFKIDNSIDLDIIYTEYKERKDLITEKLYERNLKQINKTKKLIKKEKENFSLTINNEISFGF